MRVYVGEDCDNSETAVSIEFFFFSSRRRHTRYIGDWSSDVCSSDLPAECLRDFEYGRNAGCVVHGSGVDRGAGRTRSEERRVGKECRSRRLPYHYKKKNRAERRARTNTDYKQHRAAREMYA